MNTKRLAAGLVLAAALAAPFAASALSVDDLQQQVKGLLSRIASMQSQASTSAPSSTSPAMPALYRVCPAIARNLSVGFRGTDVAALQQFLISEGYLNAQATGYFGAATRSAVAKWQASQGVSAIGSVGPMTRAKIKIRCGTFGNGILQVSPTKGEAPLTVTVTSKIGDWTDYQPSAADGRDTMIDYGDGSQRQWVHCAINAADENYPSRCQTPQSFSHTYAANGTYTVSLVKSGGMCMGGCADEVLATERVEVGADTAASNQFWADPQSGAAPLTVTFNTSIGINDALPNVDFGDGTSAAMAKGPCIGIAAIVGGTGGIRCTASVTHSYATDGMYTAKLIVNGGTANSLSIVVGGSSRGTLTAEPNYGSAPLQVNFTYLPTSETGTYWIDYGDGEGQIMNAPPIYCIKAPCIPPARASHQYANAGTYNVHVEAYISCLHSNPRCMIATMPLAQTTVTVTGSNTGSPSISQFSGPTSLAVNEIGTWKITASDPANGTLSYSILWGDEWPAGAATANRSMAPQASIQQNTTFTHSYSSAGNYTVALTVTNAAGKSARTSATVQVTQNACTADYAPVCGRPNGCANTCPAGMYCTMQCQLYSPQTYSNRCQMNNSNATFMHDGACTGNEGYLQ